MAPRVLGLQPPAPTQGETYCHAGEERASANTVSECWVVAGRGVARRATVSRMADAWISDTRSSYDTDASGYAEKVRGLLDGKPYLRASLALFAELVTVPEAGQSPMWAAGRGTSPATSTTPEWTCSASISRPR